MNKETLAHVNDYNNEIDAFIQKLQTLKINPEQDMDVPRLCELKNIIKGLLFQREKKMIFSYLQEAYDSYTIELETLIRERRFK